MTLAESVLQVLFDLMNDIWETGDLPSIWKFANVIPIPKPGKDHAEPSNYRPIVLISCVCKTFRKMFEKLVMDVVGATCNVMRLIQRFSQFI
jgi:potassium voltage-gated channel Eag-related subfamily H protein 8